jgi:hypothetical protein
MKKFIVVYYSPKGAMEKMSNASPEQMKDGMKPWMEWAEKCGSGLVDMGTPLGNGQKVTSTGVSKSNKSISGYSVLQANSIDEAVEMLTNHPHLNWAEGCEIEVHESLFLPGM